jgi:phosphinothricin acetyltransferase
MPQKLIIRFSEPEDLPFMVTIYNQAIRSKTATGDIEEFSVGNRQGWLQQFDSDSFPLYVAELEGKVVGYCGLTPYRKGRKAMQSVAEISYYIDYSYHKQGIATSLIKHVLNDCKRIGKKNLLAILLEINQPSIALLKKFGFQQWGFFPGIVEIDGKILNHVVYGLKV